MPETSSATAPRDREFRFSILLGMLILLLLTAPFAGLMESQLHLARIVMAIAFAGMLASAVYAVSDHRVGRAITLVAAVVAIALQVLMIFVEGGGLEVADDVFGIFAVGAVITLVLRHTLNQPRVSVELIAAALCVYLLLGVIWAQAYSLTEVLRPGSFRFAYDADLPADMSYGGSQSLAAIYYSFVTLTTLGYGDVVPVSAPARMLAVAQAVIGQIYLTVLVARLVGIHIAQWVDERRA